MPQASRTEELEEMLRFVADVFRTRLARAFGGESKYRWIEDVPLPTFAVTTAGAPALSSESSPGPATFVHHNNLDRDDVTILALALAPHLDPALLDGVVNELLPQPGDFPQLGGVRGTQFRGFIPTGETVQFLLGGDDLTARLNAAERLSEDRFLARSGAVHLEDPHTGEPRMSGKLVVSNDVLDLFTRGHYARPRFSLEFPARFLETEMEWEDLVLPESTLAPIRELRDWITHGDTLLFDWGMHRKLKPGYRALFHGPPGTGKTLTASLLGKYTGRDVYRVDLSMVVSKFIGETEKNLAQLFDRAESKDWILFFDEADALFSKRTTVRDAHDKYANQEVAYLLQRVEAYAGLVILASNFKSNIDDAFLRRFQSVIHFPMPKATERLKMWTRSFPAAVMLDTRVDLEQVARKHELAGAGIMNVVQYCCLAALSRGNTTIRPEDVDAGIRREYAKEGRIS